MSGIRARTFLDTAFGNGERLLALLEARRSANPGDGEHWLHYVAVVAPGWDSEHGPAILSKFPPVSLHQAADFHRWIWDDAHLSLTLCAGDGTKLLGQLQLQADAVWWLHAMEPGSASAHTSPASAIKALAALCHRGATVHTTPSWAALEAWQTAGFVRGEEPVPQWALSASGAPAALPSATAQLVFAPPWPLRRSRQLPQAAMQPPARCAVIGAGVSGAAVASALARRGWTVTVLDANPQPAQGGSGVPAALVAPLPSADDNPASRLTRHGLRWMRQTLHAFSAHGLLRQGLDWEASGVTRMMENGERLLQADGLWLRPDAWVRALLAHPHIHFYGGSRVARISRQQEVWQAEGEDGQALAQAEMVVIANAMDCQKLLRPLEIEPHAASALSMLRPAYGTVSMGASGGGAPLPAAPVNGAGSLIPTLPGKTAAEPRHWLVGADFSAQPLPLAPAHAANLQRMQALSPDMHAAWLAACKDKGAETLAHWQGQRCVSHDRMPLVGPLLAAPDVSLWISAGMGARGMAWAGICAELLACRVSGEPWPLARSLARHVDSQRRRVYIRNSI